MPQFASDAKTYALNRPLPPFRPAAAPDQAQNHAATPFQRLLDDGAPGPADRPPQAARDDHASRPERTEQAQRPARDKGDPAAKTNDNKSADAKSDDAKSIDAKSANAKSVDSKSTDQPAGAGETGKADTTANDGKETSDGKAAADAKIADKAAELSASGDGSKPAGNGKPADLAAAPAANPIATITPADAAVAALTPAPGATAQAVTAAETPAAAGPAATVAIVATAKAMPDARTLKADAGKPADQSKRAAKTELQPHTGDKPPATTGAAEKVAIGHVHSETAAKDHRAAAAEAPGTLATETNAGSPKTVADAAQPAVLTAPAQNTAPAATTLAAAAQLTPPAAAIPLAGVAIEIASKALSGTNHFEIRLDPPELGRIEVRLEVDRDGNVISRMIADRSDTLDLLRRDASGLERALQDAGLKTANNSLQFSLRDHSTGREQAHDGAETARLIVEDETLPVIEATPRDYGHLAGQGSGIDIHV